MERKETIKSAFESMMFIWGEPLDAKVAAGVVGIDYHEALRLFKELQNEYETQRRGIRIREIGESFQFCTYAENNGYIQKLCTPIKERRLTQSALEVLAIIAYKQPVTKTDIESIRGIRSDRVIEGLTKKNLVKELGRSTGIGRPILYGTTEVFLENFGLTNIKDLPKIEDIGDAIRYYEEEENDPSQITLNLE
ncbi:MAG TPA: SMC-Scp complex subunit ScpB [Anaerovoracaceae bacterium]|nr:SMC-Scp complex subunit ScpB [Anaerovoracaceae bacterium]